MERDKLISLVSRAKQGDPDALNDLFNAFYNDVYYFALKTVKDDQVACDVTQETFIEVINTLDQLEQEAAFVTWLKKITYHQCTRYFKKKKDVIVDEGEDGNTVFDTLQEEKADFIPDEALDKAEFKQTIMTMIDDLSEEQRAALMMFYFDELSIKQIAEIQETNENTVKSRLNYAKKNIKKSVEDYEKKNGVKLHCVGVLPLLLWLFKDYFAQSAPATATAVAEGVAAATGTTVTITATTTTTATVTTTAATTTAVGVGAKIASLPLVTKIVAGIVAAALVIGGATTAIVVSNNNNGDSPTEPTSHEWSEWKQTVAPSYTAKGEEVRTCSICSVTETREIAQLSLENTFKQYPDIVADLGFFTTVDELSSFGVFDWAVAHIDATSETKDFDNYIFTYTYSIDNIDAFTNRYLGRTWDYSSINHTDPGGTEYIYDGAQNAVTVVYHGAFGDAGPEITYNGYTQIDDTHYEITYSKSLYGETTNGIIKVELTGNNLVVTSHSLATDTSEDSNNNSQYYDISRVTGSSLTIEELGRRALANAEHTGGETFEDPPTAIYAVDYEASCFKDMDIFGYGVTVDEICGLGWGNVLFYSNLVGNDLSVQLNSASFSLQLPIEDENLLFTMALTDVNKFTALLNGRGDPYVSVGGTSKRGLDNLTDAVLMSAVDGSGSSPVEIFTSERFTVDGKEFGLSMTINSSMEDGVFYYRIGLHISFFNE